MVGRFWRRNRARATYRRRAGIFRLLVVAASQAAVACTFVLDIPPKPPQDAGTAADVPLKDGGAADAKGPSATSEPSGFEREGGKGGASGASAGFGGVDANAGSRSPEPCSQPRPWYRDDDGDGYGRAEQMAACPPFDGGVTVAGDCDDRNPLVHPGQVRYFDVEYSTEGGPGSFDYDCSGSEDGNPESVPIVACESVFPDGGVCSAMYEGTKRMGPAVNALCGSRTVQCAASMGIIVCFGSIRIAAAPAYTCR